MWGGAGVRKRQEFNPGLPPGGRNPSQPTPLPPRVCMSRRLESVGRASVKPMYFNTGYEHLTCYCKSLAAHLYLKVEVHVATQKAQMQQFVNN